MTIKRYYREIVGDSLHKKGLVVGMTSDRIPGDTGPVRFIFGWSLCAHMDHFDRQKANLIANGRFVNRPLEINLDNPTPEQIRVISEKLPQRMHQFVEYIIDGCRNHIAKATDWNK